uniref:ATP synthase complex subunit 8 n=1 Tax=Orophyllus montanus TaxID=948394 RepID=A0A0N7FN46_9ORTH|nr:ATP synthase F0 subunit 8 [Orophyllus montanus]
MPQMSPLSWLTLFLTFSLMLMIMIQINYSHLDYTPLSSNPSTPKHNKNSLHWKW